MPTVARNAARIAKTDVSTDESRVLPDEESTSVCIVCGRTIGSCGSMAASRCRTAGSTDAGSAASVRITMPIAGNGACVKGRMSRRRAAR